MDPSAIPSAVLAIATAIHLALGSLCSHRYARRPTSAVTIVSFVIAATPWVVPTMAAVAGGLALHAAWLATCEMLGRRARRPPGDRAPSVAAPPAAAGSIGRRSPFVQTPIVSVFDETQDIKTIRFARPEGFAFEAGQFITVRLHLDDRDHARCYSISSSPDVQGYLEISVKRQGLVSSALHATARPGATIAINRPNGKFRYPTGDRPLVLLAAGVGITPLMSMLRHAVHADPTRRVTLLYSARSVEDFAFRDEITTIARRHPHARAFFAASRHAPPEAGLYPGRIDEALVRLAVPDVADAVCCICGPAVMIDETKALLVRLGVPPAQVRFELFAAAIAAAPADEGAVHGPRRTSATEMRCARSGTTVTVAPDQTLLDAAESAGIDVPSLCRAGVCGTCRTRVTDGIVDCASTTLDDSDRRDGYVLACVATPRSACTVDL